jgi:hypothetical protein
MGSSVAGARVTRPSPWRVNWLAILCFGAIFSPRRRWEQLSCASVSPGGVVTLQVFLGRRHPREHDAEGWGLWYRSGDRVTG